MTVSNDNTDHPVANDRSLTGPNSETSSCPPQKTEQTRSDGAASSIVATAQTTKPDATPSKLQKKRDYDNSDHSVENHSSSTPPISETTSSPPQKTGESSSDGATSTPKETTQTLKLDATPSKLQKKRDLVSSPSNGEKKKEELEGKKPRSEEETSKVADPDSLFRLPSGPRHLDAESALSVLLSSVYDGGILLDNAPRKTRVVFRAAHEGDAVEVARFYHDTGMGEGKDGEGTDGEDALALALADGFGDEANPPVVFGILAHLAFEDWEGTEKRDSEGDDSGEDTTNATNQQSCPATVNSLAGVALVGLDWDVANNTRLLDVSFCNIALPSPPCSVENWHSRMQLGLKKKLLSLLSQWALLCGCEKVVFASKVGVTMNIRGKNDA